MLMNEKVLSRDKDIEIVSFYYTPLYVSLSGCVMKPGD